MDFNELNWMSEEIPILPPKEIQQKLETSKVKFMTSNMKQNKKAGVPGNRKTWPITNRKTNQYTDSELLAMRRPTDKNIKTATTEYVPHVEKSREKYEHNKNRNWKRLSGMFYHIIHAYT